MPSTSDYINQLKKDKENLVSNLVSKGVEANEEETFTSLVPKVLDVKTSEDLTDELTEQTNIISRQETTIDDIIVALQDKAYDPLLLQEKTVTPSTNEQEIVADSDYKGLSKVIINGDSDLKPENIKAGVNIFGVEGNAKTSDLKIADGSYLFYYGARLNELATLLNLCENVTSTRNMFAYCETLTDLDLSKFDVSNVTDMGQMFSNCKALNTLNLTNFDTSKVTNMSSMFSYCLALGTLDVSDFNTGAVTNMQQMFYLCSELKNLDLSTINTQNVTTMANMFAQCTGLETINVSGFNTSKVTDMSQMFASVGTDDNTLIDLDLSSFDMSKVKNIKDMFGYITSLVNFKSFRNLGKGYTQKTSNYASYKLDLSKSTNLTHDSLMSVINNLYDLKTAYGSSTYKQQLILGSENLAKLTSDEIAIATNKNWNVS